PGLPVINWVSGDLASSERVVFGDLSPDGRYAFWATSQSYAAPFGRTELSLYRRRVEPVFETSLSVAIAGVGTVERAPFGREQGGAFAYLDEDRVALRAVPSLGHRFDRWEGVDDAMGVQAVVNMHHDRQVRAVFVPMQPPVLVEALAITTLED